MIDPKSFVQGKGPVRPDPLHIRAAARGFRAEPNPGMDRFPRCWPAIATPTGMHATTLRSSFMTILKSMEMGGHRLAADGRTLVAGGSAIGPHRAQGQERQGCRR